jgi:diacylglycerol kinase family enzyme
MLGILDPTIATPRDQIAYVLRPKSLKGLRIGLVENTKKNAEAVLRRVAEKLAAAHGMKVEVLVHKPQRAPLKDEQIAQLKGRTDFIIAGVGD